jgi:hypothetical protein
MSFAARFFIFICVVLFAAVAEASFLQPKSCRDLAETELLAAAEVVGNGEVIAAGCTCEGPVLEPSYGCTATVKIIDLKKGNAGEIVYHPRFPVDAPHKEECLYYQKEMKEKIGTKKMYYFKKLEEWFVEVDSKECVY